MAILVLALSAVRLEASAGAIRITSPVKDAHVTEGQTITVTIQPEGARLQSAVAWFLPVPRELNAATRPPFDVQVKVPAGTLGRAALHAFAMTTSSQTLQTVLPVMIDLPATAGAPQNLVVRPDQIFLKPGGNAQHLSLIVTFADGIMRDVSNSEKSFYTSSDPKVATVDQDGKVQAHAFGKTAVTANYEMFSVTVAVVAANAAAEFQ